MNHPLLTLSEINAQVKLGNGEYLTTVKDISFSLERGRSYSLVGKSGSGKTSLISIIGLLNRDYTGSYLYEGKAVEQLSDREYSRLRGSNIGFVFQNYSLIKHLKVWENIDLALHYAKVKISRSQRREKIYEVLNSVGLYERRNDKPSRLSGGEQQRVAIARALVTSPKLLICDEPTGALDNATSELVMQLLQGLMAQYQTTLMLVTHDEDLARECDTIMRMKAGAIVDVYDAA